MAVNSSSTSLTFYYHCTDSTLGGPIISAFLFIHIIVLTPLSITVLHLGHRRWRQKSSFATASHADFFTYNSAAMEMIYGISVVLCICGKYAGVIQLVTAGFYACSNFFCGQISFHILTCVERYLAVVHPIIYLQLRQSERGVRIRNISTGCVWLLYCGWIGVTALDFPKFPYFPFFCLLTFSLVVVSFCSLSVLCVLIRSQPGEMIRNREQVDQLKQRAFYTITVITGVLWLYFLGLLVTFALDHSKLLSYSDGCLALICGYIVTLPSSFVLPVLFLQRAAKLVCCTAAMIKDI